MTPDVVRSPSNGISVLIAGAGVGGLTAALECWRRGCDVRIFERTATNAPQGDGFQIGLTALRMFKHWPWLKERNEEIFYPTMIAFHDITGKRFSGPIDPETLISSNKTEDGPKERRTFRHSRPKFHAMLAEQLGAIGVPVQYGKEVVDYFEDGDGAGVVLKDGSRHKADLVVAADGGRGNSWSLVAGQPVPARSSGTAMFRTAYPIEHVLQDPMVAERFPLGEDGWSIAELWAGPDTQVVFWRNQDEMMWAIDHPDSGTAEEAWGHRVDVAEALKFTATLPGWPEVGDRLLKTTPPGRLVDWKLMWRDPQPTWTSPKGFVVQLGDAAHTFLPSSGNGATQAIEDSISLAACLSIAGKEKICDATKVHNLLRFERVSCLQALGVVNRDARNTNKNKDNAKVRPRFGAWITDHEPAQYANDRYNEALDHIKNGVAFKSTNTPKNMVYMPWTIDSLMEAQEKGEPSILDADWS